MTKKSNYRRSRDKQNNPAIKHHICKARVRPETNNPYAYCQICGRAMKAVPIAKLKELMDKARIELPAEQLAVLGIQEKHNEH